MDYFALPIRCFFSPDGNMNFSLRLSLGDLYLDNYCFFCYDAISIIVHSIITNKGGCTMKTISNLLAFSISSGFCLVLGRTIGKLAIWLFPQINITYTNSYTEVFLRGAFSGFGAGTCWILFASHLIGPALRSKSPESIKLHVAGIYAVYVITLLGIGIWPP